MTRYRVVRGRDTGPFLAEVERLLAAGWQLCGGVSQSVGAPGIQPFLAQALRRESAADEADLARCPWCGLEGTPAALLPHLRDRRCTTTP